MKQILNNRILSAIIIVLVIALLLEISLTAVQKKQDIRQKAATPGGQETILLSPTNTSYIVGVPISIILSANLTNTAIDGFQVVTDITGTVPSNLSFQVASISGVTCVRNILSTTDTGKRLELAFITTDPQVPFAAQGLVTLGTITGNVSNEGAMTISYNTALTKITKNQTAEDIVNIPQNSTYTFVNPTPTSTPTPTNSPTPSPTPAPINCSPNGSVCITTICPTMPPCPSNLVCAQMIPNCTTHTGICTNGRCVPTITPIPTKKPTVTPTLVLCNIADINKDGVVNKLDLSLITPYYWSTLPLNTRADVNHDGVVDILDYSIIVKNLDQSTGRCH